MLAEMVPNSSAAQPTSFRIYPSSHSHPGMQVSGQEVGFGSEHVATQDVPQIENTSFDP